MLEPPPHVKIAIIDTGVDVTGINPTWNGLFQRCIAQGTSFVQFKDSITEIPRESPWWISSEPHGTQMATIICKLDSQCKLFIAKVGTGRDDISISNLIQVGQLNLHSIFDLELTIRRQLSGPGRKRSILSALA